MSTINPLRTYLQQLHHRFGALQEGNVADYIPELAKVNPDSFGIVLVTTDGEIYGVGDTEIEFTIQSISKAFMYATALTDRGAEYILNKVYVEPTGDAFNSISLHPETGAPLNPMINAGAIAISGLVGGETPAAQWQRIISSLSAFAGRSLSVDEEVYQSESNTGFRNRAIGWMLRNFGILEQDPTEIVENYFRQCSVLVNCVDLGIMGATLANGGINPVTGERVLPEKLVCPTLSVMSTCGMYDYAGSWMYEVGLPAKSGVGGGIVAVLPGRFAVATLSPRLDAKGNSLRGIEVCKALSTDLGLHVIGTVNNAIQVISREYSCAEAGSNRKRSVEAKYYLAEHGKSIRVLVLQGDIALDGAERISRRLVKDTTLTHVILDMHRVAHISNPAARLIIDSIESLCQRQGDLVFSRLNKGDFSVESVLLKVAADLDAKLKIFPDNDRAMEYCEEQLLNRAQRNWQTLANPVLKDFELFSGLPDDGLEALSALLILSNYEKGETIIQANENWDDRVFMILSGEVSVLVATNHGYPLKPGQI